MCFVLGCVLTNTVPLVLSIKYKPTTKTNKHRSETAFCISPPDPNDTILTDFEGCVEKAVSIMDHKCQLRKSTHFRTKAMSAPNEKRPLLQIRNGNLSEEALTVTPSPSPAPQKKKKKRPAES